MFRTPLTLPGLLALMLWIPLAGRYFWPAETSAVYRSTLVNYET
jgi:hypothetical protein